ncbi:MAG: glycosyltransferase family 1 protein, partial [Candidatus Magasanikbacteria bacterium]|nr:glycosyltransferase family 1 protein [Candidatus Magasanikbacteria bacterium]
MVIGVDGNEANVDEKVGVSLYTLNLLRYFESHATRDVQFVIYLRTPPTVDLPGENQFYKYRIVKGKFLWSQIFLPYELFIKRQINGFFAPAHYAPRFCPVPCVVTVHDLSYLLYPNEFKKTDLYQLTHWTKYSVRRAKHIIAVSKTTKKDIIKNYQISDQSVSIIYNGFEKQSNKNQETKILNKNHLKSGQYILFVGTVQPRKNLQLLIAAFDKYFESYKDYKLVIAGRDGWLSKPIYEKVHELGIEQSVIFTCYVSDDERTDLYKNALAFVMPSLYEGFGIPVLEAMSNKCPVIASQNSSLPEVGGDACLYFDPLNLQDLLEALIAITEKSELRKELISKGEKQISKFSWEKTA